MFSSGLRGWSATLWDMNAEWVAVVLTLIGFVGSLAAAWFARKEQMAAGRSADLAREVQESMAASQAAIAAALERPRVAFEAGPHSVRTWVLRNKGPEAATGLVVDWPDWVRLIVDPAPTSLEIGEAIEFSGTMRRPRDERETTMLVVCSELPQGIRVPLPSF